MAYPFFLKKLLARAGLGRMLPSLRRLAEDGASLLDRYSDRVLAAPYDELRDLVGFQALEGSDTLDLASGEPRFDVVPSSSTKLPADLRGLPPAWGLPELREAIAEKLAATGSLSHDAGNEVLVTAGASGAFGLAADSFLNPGDQVVLFDPASLLYSLVLWQRRARIRWLPTWMENGRTRFHFEPLVKALKHARMIVVNSPANPTGGVISPEDLEQIAWWAARHNVLIFNDQVFAGYRYEGQHVEIGALAKAGQRTLTAGSLSKSHALAAARVGWLAGPRRLVVPCMLTAALQSAMVPTLCQQIALAALRLGDDVLLPIRKEFASRRSYAFGRLQAVGLQPAWPAGAFFLWVPVRELGLNGRQFADQLAGSKKVLVWPGDHFGPSGTDYVRISYATDEGRLHQGLTRLVEFVRDRQALRVGQARRAA